MANLMLLVRAAEQSAYTVDHIRWLLRKGLVQGEKQGGTWLVDFDDLQRYEREMGELGAQRYDPFRRKPSRRSPSS